MKVFLALLLLLNPVAALACGRERWAVKVLSDPLSSQINFFVHRTTLAELTARAAPYNPVERQCPDECEVDKITATITLQKSEADQDFHLVLTDDLGNTMIAEIPSPSCAVPGTPGYGFAKAWNKMRTNLKVGARVNIWGVYFFDRIHGQTGVAPNGSELHPVIGIAYL